MAARLRRELGIEAELVPGRYGEFRVLVDGKEVASAGALGFAGILPSSHDVVEAVRQAASSAGSSRR